MIGNTEQREKLKQNILDKVPTIIHGDPGIGKTSSVYTIANTTGHKVIEINASNSRRKEDVEKIYRRTLMGTYTPVIYLFDEADGLGKENKGTDKRGGKSVPEIICDIIDQSPHAIVFTANNLYEVPESIKKKCVAIHYFQPNIIEVVTLTRAIAQHAGLKNVRYDQVSGDVRSSINAVLYGSEKPESENLFSIVGKILRAQPFDLDMLTKDDRRNLDVWLSENIPLFYEGVEMAEAFWLLAKIQESGNEAMYKLFPQGKLSAKVQFPSYYRRMGMIHRKKQEDNKK